MQPTRTLDSLHRKEWHRMGKRIAVAQAAEVETSFGERLASLRKAAGFTQIELAAELGISQRMGAYYGVRRPRRRPICCRRSPRHWG
jgi:ribosome-binding protein aMBF1 (putative translation factor)